MEVVVGKIAAYLSLILIVKEFKINVEQGRVTTLNIMFRVVKNYAQKNHNQIGLQIFLTSMLNNR
jgi:hypothetical protein